MTTTDDSRQTAAHTPEPWAYSEYPGDGDYTVHQDEFHPATSAICIVPFDETRFGEANALRICAAVNACQGISTESLGQGVVRQLVEALEDLYNWLTPDRKQSILGDKARTAIAKATGRAV